MLNNLENKEKGFSLAELLIALFVLTIGILGAYTAIQRAIYVIDYSSARLTAAYLGQEAIEIVRNIKDTNLIEEEKGSGSWDEGLIDGTYEVEYPNVLSLDPVLTPCIGICEFNNLRYLKNDGGMYNYLGSEATRYKRKMEITHIGANTLKLETTVYWRSKGGNVHQFEVQENLYNWW